PRARVVLRAAGRRAGPLLHPGLDRPVDLRGALPVPAGGRGALAALPPLGPRLLRGAEPRPRPLRRSAPRDEPIAPAARRAPPHRRLRHLRAEPRRDLGGGP